MRGAERLPSNISKENQVSKMTKYEMAITLLQDAHERMTDYQRIVCMACGEVLRNDSLVGVTGHAKECLIVEIDKFLGMIDKS